MVVAGCTTPITDDPNLQRILKPYMDSPNTANLKIEDCVYFDKGTGLTGRAILLNPDGDRLAHWTISACKATAEGTTDRCLMSVANNLWCPSNAHFPITGTVTEDGA